MITLFLYAVLSLLSVTVLVIYIVRSGTQNTSPMIYIVILSDNPRTLVAFLSSTDTFAIVASSVTVNIFRFPI